jgi:Tat protein secretion system quality control protein TatD with DNase activity
MRFFDTHAHYNDEIFNTILDEILKKCKKSSVE